MKVTCTHGCNLVFDDAVRDTICPHNELIGPYAHPETEQGKKDQAALTAFVEEYLSKP